LPDRGLLPAGGLETIQAVEMIFLKSRGRADSQRLPQDSPNDVRTTWAIRACGGVVAVFLCCCAGMILIDLYREAQVEQALAKIQTAGGLYMRLERGHSRPVIGIDLDATIVYDTGEVRVRGPVTDATLLAVARLSHLEVLSLDGADVTDAGLVNLKRLKKLRRLNLSRTPLTDAGLGFLKELPDLRTIDLRGTTVTAASVKKLQLALPKAEILADGSDR
jgi:hypothetical protein